MAQLSRALGHVDTGNAGAARLFGAVLIVATVALGVPPDVAAASSERDRALQLAREARCRAAVPELEALLEANPKDGELGLATGECLIRLQRYADAVERLEATRAVDPDREGVDAALAIAFYHAENPEAADEALSRAEARNPDRAKVQLYRGLLLLGESENESGAAALEQASVLDPAYAEPVSSFYQGLALGRVDEERARAALNRVIAGWPGTTWADEARRALAELDAGESDFSWWLNASIGVEFDSNVVLRGSGVDLPDDISDEEDWRGVWSLSGGTTLYRDENWTVGVSASYYGNRQDDVTDFDIHYPTISGWVDRALAERTFLRGRYEYGFAWVGGDEYLSEHRVEASLLQDFEDWGRTRFELRFLNDDFRFRTVDVAGPDSPGAGCPPNLLTCGPFGLNEASARNRDGWEFGAGFLHVFPLPDLPGLSKNTVRGGYDYSIYDSRGQEYSYMQHGFALGAATTLPWNFQLDVEASFLYRPYRNPSTFPDSTPTDGTQYQLSPNKRREREWLVGAKLTRPLTKYLSLELSWSYDDNDSTAAVFDYDRHVVGLRLQGRVAP